MTHREKQELIDRLFGAAFAKDSNTLPKHRKPGTAVQAMSIEDREKLAELVADDFNHPRIARIR